MRWDTEPPEGMVEGAVEGLYSVEAEDIGMGLVIAFGGPNCLESDDALRDDGAGNTQGWGGSQALARSSKAHAPMQQSSKGMDPPKRLHRLQGSNEERAVRGRSKGTTKRQCRRGMAISR